MDMKAVKDLLASHWDFRLPVRPDSIAQSLGIFVTTLNENNSEHIGLSGLAVKEGESQYIFYNRGDHPNRQRFTIAHELAHHVLGHTANGMCFRDDPAHYSTRVQSKHEKDANEFAAELLMPESAIKQLIERMNIKSSSHLAAIFSVSEAAMHWRILKLGIGLDVY